MLDYLEAFKKFQGLRERLLETMKYDPISVRDLSRRIKISEITLKNFIQDGKNKTRLSTLMRILKYVEMCETINK